MSMKLIHYVKWAIFGLATIYLNYIILLTSGNSRINIYYIHAILWIGFMMLFESILRKKLDMIFDYTLLIIFITSILQIANIVIQPTIFMMLPSLIILVLIIYKFFQIKNAYLEFEMKETLEFTLALYFVSFSLVSLALILKSAYLYLLIGFIPLYLLSSGLLISKFKEFEKRQYLIYLSVVTFVMIYLSTSLIGELFGEYNLIFSINYVIPTLIFLLHTIPIRKVCLNEISSLSKKKKKVKK